MCDFTDAVLRVDTYRDITLTVSRFPGAALGGVGREWRSGRWIGDDRSARAAHLLIGICHAGLLFAL